MTKRLYIIATLLLVAGFSKIKAQQLPLYSNYFFTPYVYNPSQSGTDGTTELTILHRRQWTDVQGSPETSALAINGSLNEQKIGWSVYAFSDVTDIISRNGIYGNYAYRLKLADNTTLSFGLGAGYINNTIDQSAIRSKDSEAIISVTTDNRGNFDLNSGVNLEIADFTLGVAIPQILNPSIEYTENTTQPVNYSLIRHYVVNASYDFRFKGKDNVLTPLMMLKAAKNVPIQFDLGLLFNLKDYGYVGAMFRSDYAVTSNIGLNLTEELTLGYAYDFSINTFASNLGTSHEFMLTYRFGSDKKTERLENQIKKLKQTQRKQKTEVEKTVDEKLDEFKDEYKRELKKEFEEAVSEAKENASQNNSNDQQGNNNNRSNNRNNNDRKGGDQNDNGNQQQQNGNNNSDDNGNNNSNDNGNNNDGNQDDGSNDYNPSNQASNVQPGSNGYYVVAGVFSSQPNAQKLINRLGSQGVTARYFQDKSNYYYYVYLLKFDSYQQAEGAKGSSLNGSYSGDLWIKIVE